LLCYILALYGLAVLGYITAFLARFFIGRDTEEKNKERGLTTEEVASLKKEILEIKKILNEIREERTSK
jgi:voltage-gated potassium channel